MQARHEARMEALSNANIEIAGSFNGRGGGNLGGARDHEIPSKN